MVHTTLSRKSVGSRYGCTKGLHFSFPFDKVDTFKQSNNLSTISMNIAVSIASALPESLSALDTVALITYTGKNIYMHYKHKDVPQQLNPPSSLKSWLV